MADSCTNDARTSWLETPSVGKSSPVPVWQQGPNLPDGERPRSVKAPRPPFGKQGSGKFARGKENRTTVNHLVHRFCSVVPFAKRDRGTHLKHQRDHNGEHYHTFNAVGPLASMNCSVVPFCQKGQRNIGYATGPNGGTFAPFSFEQNRGKLNLSAQFQHFKKHEPLGPKRFNNF